MRPPPGAGDELTRLVKQLGIAKTRGCGCAEMAREMNALGIEGCRAKRDELAARLRAKSKEYAWTDWASAAANAAVIGLALRLNWSDPFPGLIDLAIESTTRIGPPGG